MRNTSVAIFIVMMIFLVMAIFLTMRENAKLTKENEDLILKNDSLHMIHLKTKQDLKYSINKLDSISTNFSYRRKKK